MIILLFPNIRAVIRAEKHLLNSGVKVSVRPVPTNITAECGMCLEINDSALDEATKSLLGSGFSVTVKKI